MKVMNGLVMTLEEDKIFLCVWLLYYVSNFADAKIYQVLLHEIIFFLSVFSNSEVLAKINSIRSKLPTAACWSQENKERKL